MRDVILNYVVRTRKRQERVFNHNHHLGNGQQVAVRYKPLSGKHFDHQRRKVISDFPRFADEVQSMHPWKRGTGQALPLHA